MRHFASMIADYSTKDKMFCMTFINPETTGNSWRHMKLLINIATADSVGPGAKAAGHHQPQHWFNIYCSKALS